MQDGLSDYVDGRHLARHVEGGGGRRGNSTTQASNGIAGVRDAKRCKEMQERYSSARLSLGCWWLRMGNAHG